MIKQKAEAIIALLHARFQHKLLKHKNFINYNDKKCHEYLKRRLNFYPAKSQKYKSFRSLLP